MYRTLNGLMNFLSIYQQIYQVRHLALFFNKNYIRLYPLTIDATRLNYNSFFPERTGNNSLNSTFINKDILIGTRNLTQQDTPHFVNEEIVETITTTEAHRSISPVQPNFTTPNLKSPTLQRTVIQSTIKPSVAQNFSQMDYQTFRPVTKPSYKQHRNNFAEHNYNYFNGPKTTKAKNKY